MGKYSAHPNGVIGGVFFHLYCGLSQYVTVPIFKRILKYSAHHTIGMGGVFLCPNDRVITIILRVITLYSKGYRHLVGWIVIWTLK